MPAQLPFHIVYSTVGKRILFVKQKLDKLNAAFGKCVKIQKRRELD